MDGPCSGRGNRRGRRWFNQIPTSQDTWLHRLSISRPGHARWTIRGMRSPKTGASTPRKRGSRTRRPMRRHSSTSTTSKRCSGGTTPVSSLRRMTSRATRCAPGARCGPLVMSLEAVAPVERHVARARYGVTPLRRSPYHPGISDLLLFDPADSLPATLDAVLPHAYGSTRVSTDRKLGVFWELYGADPAAGAVGVSLTLSRQGSGWLRRAVESLGLAGPRRDVRLEWQEMPESASIAPRTLALDLSGLAPGRYLLQVAVTPAGAETVTAQREILIERP